MYNLWKTKFSCSWRFKNEKEIISVVLLFVFTCALIPKASAAGFPDVKPGDWAETYISKAAELGIMGGYSNGKFGYGDKVTRSQFTAMLVRLFHWERVSPDAPTFQDNTDKNAWYYGDIETAVKTAPSPPTAQNSGRTTSSPGRRWP